MSGFRGERSARGGGGRRFCGTSVNFRGDRPGPPGEISDRRCMKRESPVSTDLSPLIDLREARVLLGGISPQLLYRLIADGQLRLVKIRRRSFIRQDDVEALIERSTRRTAR